MPRYTIDLGDSFDKKLSNLADSKGISKAEVIRNALASYEYLQNETSASNEEGGSKTVSITKDGTILKDIVLP
jgi:predicted transcriptional regulator